MPHPAKPPEPIVPPKPTASLNPATTDLDFADALWKSADALRGQVDAAEYKHVVLGLLFLKYISDSFEDRREWLKAELEKDGIKGKQLDALLESRDEYTAERVFWVPPESRWPNIQNQATRPEIATLIDDAILAVERDNPGLKGKLPRDYARRGIEPVKMKGLIDLIANIGFKGGRGKAREPTVFESSIIRARPDPAKADPHFLFYLWSSPVGAHLLSTIRRQVAVAGITGKDLEQLEVPIPDVEVQRDTAAVLGSLDDKIEHNRRTSRALEGLARAMFKAWFVDFEPVHAKAAGATAYPGMPPEAFAALPTTFTDSPLGRVPEGWEVGRLDDHCEINRRSVRKGEIEGEIEYVDISSVTVGRLDGVQRMPFADAPSRARRRIAHGDTIWSCVRPNHRSYLFIHSPPDHRLVSTGFAVLSPADFGPSYLHELTTRQEFVDYLVANADGSAYPAVRPEHFAAAQVLVPPQGLRRAFEGITMPFRDLIAALDEESRKLAELRDYLLPKLLSGGVRVSQAERATAGVT